MFLSELDRGRAGTIRRAYAARMENLNQSVYECTLAVEAHMICDLLARAGISARVDGEFLTGAGGELPLGNTVRVRVDPSRAAEAREVIADWEKLQPVEPTPPPKASRPKLLLCFLLGVICGGALVLVMLRNPAPRTAVDCPSSTARDC